MSFYEILGVSKTATDKEIKKAYKNLVKKYHPDVFDGDKSLAESKIKEINDAYDTLSIPELREEYDRSLEVPDSDSDFDVSVYDTSESDVQKRYNEFNNRYENMYKYGKYTTNYYGVSHDASKVREWSNKNNQPARDSDFLGGSRSTFVVGMAFVLLLLLVFIILWLSFMRKYVENVVPISNQPAYQDNQLPFIDFDMTYDEVINLLGKPDQTQSKGSNLYAYWENSYIIFNKNLKVSGWKNNGAFLTDEYTGAESKFIRELYNSVNSSDFEY